MTKANNVRVAKETASVGRVDDLWDVPRALVFEAIVSAGSISAAARQLKLTKSVVSAHLRQLEEVCGVRLLERSTRRQRLTDAGRLFLVHAQQIASSWREGLEGVRAAAAEPMGQLRISATTIFQRGPFAATVERFVRLYPQVSLEITFDDQSVNLIGDDVDLAIRTGPLTDSSLIARRLGEDRDVLVAAPRLAERLGELKHPQQLSGERWLRHAQRAVRRELVGPELHGREELFTLETNSSIVVNSATGLLALVSAGCAVALAPRLFVADALAAGEVVELLPQWHTPAFSIYAVYPSREQLPAKISRFVALLMEAIGDAT